MDELTSSPAVAVTDGMNVRFVKKDCCDPENITVKSRFKVKAKLRMRDDGEMKR
ncbi:hypothetical protein ACVOMV_08100 [Mesorhizobium atlanticum]